MISCHTKMPVPVHHKTYEHTDNACQYCLFFTRFSPVPPQPDATCCNKIFGLVDVLHSSTNEKAEVVIFFIFCIL